MDFKNHVPIFIQVIDIIKRDVISGKRFPGDKLDSVRDFAKTMKVNPNTVQKAYQEMERMDLAFTKRGIGTFISEDKNLKTKLMFELSSQYVNNFIENMKSLGYTESEILERLEERLAGGDA